MDSVRFERLIALPRAIVWEALVDPVLVEGWLHPVERLVSGTVQRIFIEPESADDAQLDVMSPVFGSVSVRLSAEPGGPRGESTRLVIDVSDEWGRRDERSRLWQLRIDQLEDLLRGHPVDWSTWTREHRTESAAAVNESAARRIR